MKTAVKFGDLSLEVVEHKDTWGLSNKQVAEGFGVSEEAIRSQKLRGEYQENVHFYTVANCNGGGDLTFWTKKGVVTLGFKLRETPQTIAFRDWASDFILKREKPVSIQNILADPRAFAELALRYADEQDKNKQLVAKIEADAPYTNFGKIAEFSKGAAAIGDFAKMLCDKNIKIGRNRLFRLLRELKILMANNEPYQQYVENGYFERKPSQITKPNGISLEVFTTKITTKGQVALTDKIVEALKIVA